MTRSRSPRSGCAFARRCGRPAASSRERELLRVRAAGPTTTVGAGRGRAARALRRRAAAAPCARRSRPTRPSCATRDDAEPRRRCSTPAAPSADLPQALAAVDLALWDRAGRREGRPVAQLLADGAAPTRSRVNATIAAEDRAGAAGAGRAPRRARASRCVKVKVGIGDDAGRVAAVRAAAGPEVALRLDANGAWDVDEALAQHRARSRPPGSSSSRSRCTASTALRAVRGRVAGAGRDGRDGGRAGRCRRRAPPTRCA